MKKLLLPFLLITFVAKAQLVVTSGASGPTVSSSINGGNGGITISNMTINCAAGAYGTFSNGNTTNLGVTDGIILTTGSAAGAIGPNSSGSTGQCIGTSSTDPQLTIYETHADKDLCVVEFDFVPQCSQISLRFVFGSEEYPEFVSNVHNDAFGVFISGPGPACQPGYYNNTTVSTLPDASAVSIDNVNSTANASYYVDNTGGSTIQYDGFTTALTRNINVCACQTYHFKIAIADAADCNYDSGVFIDFLQCNSPLSATVTSTPATCGNANGTATVTASGPGPFTYSWAPSGGTGTTATGLTGGTTYTVTVNDGLACSPAITRTVTIASTPLPTATTSKVNVLCNGACTGSATVVASGGTAPYTYSWAPSGGSGATASSLCAGTYTCTITDASSCSITKIFTITQPSAAVSGTTVVTNVACFGGNTGAINLTPSGGTPGYTFNWGGGVTTEDRTGLIAGTYNCTITDANGCTGSVSGITLTQPSAAVSGTTVVTNVACFGGTTGAINLTPSGGTPGYTFNWGGGVTTEDRTGLIAGTYNCTITDANGCTGSVSSITVTQPTSAVSGTTVVTNVACFGGTTGAINLTPSGGTPGYTFNWGGGVTTEDRTSLTAGTYNCTITDANGCAGSVSGITVTQPPSAVSGTTVVTNVACFGGTTGAINLTPSGGTPGYTFNWGGGVTTEDRTSLTAGTYTCTITDANGCAGSVSGITVTQPSAAVSGTTVVTNVACFGGTTGAINLTPSGGTPGYTFNWGGGVTTEDRTSLTAGTYNCTITDANGCAGSVSGITVTEPPSAVSGTTVVTNVACFGGTTGAINLTPSGGTPGYTFNWGGGVITEDRTSLAAGTYNCTITDANGCTATTSITVTEPTALMAMSSATTVMCNGGTADITVSAMDGTAPYSGTGTFTVPAGNYNYIVTDNNGCTASTSITVTQPTVLMAMSSATSIACNGDTADITVSAMDGTAPYTGTGTFAVIAGTYLYTVTDGNGCVANTSITVTEPTLINSTTSTVSSTCGTPNGSATVLAGGGTSAYTYVWSSGGTSDTESGLASGTYTVTITDANGCTATNTASVNDFGAATVTGLSGNVTCNGGNDGFISLATTGGTAPFDYSWNTADTTQNISALTAGTYNYTVTDSVGCQATGSVTITEPSAIDVTTTLTGVTITANNTTASSYQWIDCSTMTPLSAEVDSSFTPLVDGDYAVIITEGFCPDTSACVTVVGTGIASVQTTNVTIYPNPSSGLFVITGLENGAVVIIYNALGEQIEAIRSNASNAEINISAEKDGIYFIRISNPDGSSVMRKAIKE